MTMLLESVIARRNAIRHHRDQTGDDRCWVDDYALWKHIDGSPVLRLPVYSAAMDSCRAFHQFRNAPHADPVPPEAVTDPAKWDDDARRMTEAQRADEYARLGDAIRAHRDIRGRARTASDDRALYAALPEKIPADFRLPPEDQFLGEAKAPHAGCPSFWRSHADCPGAHDLHKWGPCTKKSREPGP